jgi:hypothetical protein
MRSTTCGDGCNLISPNYIRITPFGSLAAGREVTANDNVINKPLSGESEEFEIMFINLYGGPGYDFDDPVYLRYLDLVLLRRPMCQIEYIVNGFSAGTEVLDYNGDHNKPLVSLHPYAISFFIPTATIMEESHSTTLLIRFILISRRALEI